MKMIAVIGLSISSMIFVPGFSFAQTGSVRINNEVAKDFEAYRFDPKYDYYFMNLKNSPCAVVGLQKDYAIHDIQWKKLYPGSSEFKNVIELVKRFPMSGSHAFGAYILDSQKNTIGVYYSGATIGVTVDKESKILSLTMFMGGDSHN
jgi:hypothetical protein